MIKFRDGSFHDAAPAILLWREPFFVSRTNPMRKDQHAHHQDQPRRDDPHPVRGVCRRVRADAGAEGEGEPERQRSADPVRGPVPVLWERRTGGRMKIVVGIAMTVAACMLMFFALMGGAFDGNDLPGGRE